MDDLIEGLIGTGIGVALVVAFGAIYAAGWLVYKLFEVILIPLCCELAEEADKGLKRLAAWHHRVTWRRRMVRAHNETIAAIDAVRSQQVALTRVRLEALERQHELQQRPQNRTADATVVVPSAVRVADRAA
ncbi:MAG: hypothetical protein GXY79_03250 [Chloroflexi bacterium]|nr:hypothetical protein [Chloroflexota bacterium]